MDTSLPPAGPRPWLLSIAVGVVCAMMFSLKPLLDLFDIPPLRVLRRNLGDSIAISRIHMGLSVATIFALMWLFSRDIKITAILFSATALLMAVLFVVSRLLFKAGRSLGLSPGSSWSLAIATLQKRANANAIQLISFALAIKLMLFLVVLKNDMISDWQMQVPPDAPNAFFININEREIAPMAAQFEQNAIPHEHFYPVFRGRVNALNGEEFARRASLQEGEQQDEEAREGVGRELSLTWLNELPEGSEIVAGQWFDDTEQLQVSVAEGVAERVGIAVGDTLSFLINNQTIEAKVSSIRSVNWGSLKPNFVMIFNAQIAGQFPVTYFTAAKLGSEDNETISALLKQYPTISMIDIQSQIKQAQSMISQVSMAISFVLSIVLISGSLVLISQVQASLAERMQETVILRTLGAKGRLIKLATLYEFLMLGALAGLVAAIVSDITLFVIQVQTFDVAGRLHPYIWLLGPATGALSGPQLATLWWLKPCAKTPKVCSESLPNQGPDSDTACQARPSQRLRLW